MAEGSREGCGAGASWWGEWIKAAKDKGAGALDLMKKDLADFTVTMCEDTVKVADTVKEQITQENASTATKKVKDGALSFLGGISRVLTIPPDDTEAQEVVVMGGKVYDRATAQLNAIKLDPATYCVDPPGPPEDFTEWQKTFNLEAMKGDISELLVVNVEVRGLYTQLVPSQVSHSSFWQRYFYRLELWRQEQERKEALMRRADQPSDNQDLQWDDDEWGDSESPTSAVPRSSPDERLKPDVQKRETNNTESESVNEMTSKREKNVKQAESVATVTVPQPPEPEKPETPNIPEAVILSEAASPSEAVSPTEAVSPPDNLSSPSVSLSSSPTPSSPITGLDSSLDTLTMISPLTSPVTNPLQSKIDSPVSPLGNEQSTEVKSEITQDLPPVTPVTETTAPFESVTAPESATSEADVKESEKEVKTRDKGDMVVVGSGSDRTTPSSDSHSKDASTLDEDWEQDFDLEVTEDDLKLAQQAMKEVKLDGENTAEAEDWENWE